MKESQDLWVIVKVKLLQDLWKGLLVTAVAASSMVLCGQGVHVVVVVMSVTVVGIS